MTPRLPLSPAPRRAAPVDLIDQALLYAVLLLVLAMDAAALAAALRGLL